MRRLVAMCGDVPSRTPPTLTLPLLTLLLMLFFGGGGSHVCAQAPPLHSMRSPACAPYAPATYTAAVVEFSPALGVTLDNARERFRENVEHYVDYAKVAKRQGAEIVVFPECGLGTLEMPTLADSSPAVALPLPQLGSNPCVEDDTDYPEELRALSCAARDAAIYIVVNLPEEEQCSPALAFCPECPGFDLHAVRSGVVACNLNGKRFFNSDIAFDRKGSVVAKYRKYNLFGEAGFVPPAEPSLEFFDSDFGPRFGLFTCFDLMFEQPAVTLVTEAEVTDIVFPTAWFSELPFLTAVQAQASWSWVLDVNFLGSGYNLPEVGSTGSGIYAGRRGKVVATMERERTNKLLVGKLPNRNACSFNATASSMGNPRLEGKVVILDRDNWDPEPPPLPTPATLQPCVDQLPPSDVDVPSLYQCHLNTMLQGERHTEMRKEVEADDLAGEAEGEEEDAVEYELRIPRRRAGGVEGEREEEELIADEEEFKEAAAQVSSTDLRQLIEGPPFRRYIQDVMIAGMRPLQSKSDRYSGTNTQIDKDEEDDETEQSGKEFGPKSTASSGRLEAAMLQEQLKEYPPNEEENVKKNVDDLLEEVMLEGVKKEDGDRLRRILNEQVLGLDILEDDARDEVNVDDIPMEATYQEMERKEVSDDLSIIYTQDMPEDVLLNKAIESPDGPLPREVAEEVEYLLEDWDNARDDPVYEERFEKPLHEDTKSKTSATGRRPPGCQCAPSSIPSEEEEEDEEDRTEAWREQEGVRGRVIARGNNYLYLKTEDLSEYVSVLLPSTRNDISVSENSSIFLCHGSFCCDFQIVLTVVGRDGDAVGEGDGDDDRNCKCELADRDEQVRELEELVMDLLPEEEVPPPPRPLQSPLSPIKEVSEEEEPKEDDENELRYFYRAVVFNGQRTFDGVTEGGLQVCGIIPCTSTDVESCGKLHAGQDVQEVTFRHVRISGHFAHTHALPLPSTLDAQLMPLPADAFSLKATIRRKDQELVLETQKELNFLTFGIYNRNFANDPERQQIIE